MAARLTYTTGTRSVVLDRWKSSGLTGKGGLGPYYVQQFAREQSRIIVEQ